MSTKYHCIGTKVVVEGRGCGICYGLGGLTGNAFPVGKWAVCSEMVVPIDGVTPSDWAESCFYYWSIVGAGDRSAGSVIYMEGNTEGGEMKMEGTNSLGKVAKEREEVLALLENAVASRLPHEGTMDRRQLAREVHDGIGHHLSCLLICLENLQDEVNAVDDRRAELAEKIRKIIGYTDSASSDLRRMVNGLTPVDVTTNNLNSLLLELVDRTQFLTSTSIEMTFHPFLERLSNVQASDVYRIVQEGLANAIKRRAAKNIVVSFEGADSTFVVQVLDDGPSNSDEFTECVVTFPRSLNERASQYGGRAVLSNLSSKQFCLRVELNLDV